MVASTPGSGSWESSRVRDISTFFQKDANSVLRPGHGVLQAPNGEEYNGEWEDGIREGKGKAKLPRFQNSVFVGFVVYEGQFKDGNWHGEGTVLYPDGAKYTGPFKEGAYHGHGIAEYADGSVYDGEWESNVKCGSGLLQYPDGQRYEGEWKDDLQDGKGTYTQARGVVYQGRYKQGVKHGCGLMKLADGSLQQQEFTNGELVRTWEADLMQKLFN